MKTALKASAVLLVVSTSIGIAQWSPKKQDKRPSRFLNVELLSVGGSPMWYGANLLSATLMLGRFRLGTTLLESNSRLTSTAPLRVGYSISRAPHKYLAFYGMVPDLYVEASAYVLNWGLGGDAATPPTGRLALFYAMDYYGLGAQVGFGLVANVDWVEPVLDARLRLLTTNFGL